MMEFDIGALVRDLRKITVETGHMSAACLGCGYEHNCSVHGCALIRSAADALEQTEADWQRIANALADAGVHEQRLANQLRESEAARSDLGKRLAAAEKRLAADEVTT